jgi:hypothetical protein
LLPLFATGVNDTGGKFAAGVVDIGGNVYSGSQIRIFSIPDPGLK